MPATYETPRCLDPEKAATTPITMVVIAGIRITSRWQKQDELVWLTRLVELLPLSMRKPVAEVWCDSRQSMYVVVEMVAGQDRPEVTCPIAREIDRLMRGLVGGHNGIEVGDTATVGPWWVMDEAEFGCPF